MGDLALEQRLGASSRRRSRARAERRHRRRRSVRPVGRVPVAPARLSRHAVRIATRAGRADALRHPVVPAGAQGARRRDRRASSRSAFRCGTRSWPARRTSSGCAPTTTRSTWRWAPARPKRLPQLPAQAPWLMDGAEYLARTNAGAPPLLGKRTRRDRRRQCRARCRAQRPSCRSRGDDPRAGTRPTDAGAASRSGRGAGGRHRAGRWRDAQGRDADQRASGWCCSANACSSTPGPSRGQFTIEPLANSEFTLDADAIVTSIGQDPELAALDATLPSTAGCWWWTRARRRFGAGRVGGRRRGEHGALRHRGDRHGQARGARHRSCAARRSRASGARPRKRAVAIDAICAVSPRKAARVTGAAPPGRRAAGQRRRSAAGARAGAGAGRGRALLFVRHLHPLRQLLPLLSRPRDPCACRAAMRC